MPYQSTTLTLPAYNRGIHLITSLINKAYKNKWLAR